MNSRKILCAALLGVLALQPYRPYVVSGDSMSPTLASGQWLFGDSRPRQIGRGDVVVFRHGDETMIKRVAFLPGDRIERYYCLGEWKIPVNRLMRDVMARRFPRRDLEVPQASLWVVGDNIYQSVDSREYGPIPMRDVVAVVPKVRPSEDSWSAPVHLTQALFAAL